MPWMLERDDIGALSIGAALLSGGGGGHTRIASLASQGSVSWPIAVHEVQEVDPELPCVAVGVGGSTMVFRERLPSGDLFQEAIEAVDRWTGTPAAAVCLTEIGGMNALTALPHAASMTLIDSDLMGRALPGIDQFTLLVDDLSALVLAVSVGQRGVMVVADARPGDVEHVLRAAFETAGGWAGIALGGFRVGDLAEHAVGGSLRRALDLGRSWGVDATAPIADRAVEAGGRHLGIGRVTAISLHSTDPRVRIIDVDGASGAQLRLVATTEVLACMLDGRVVARAPDIIDVLDPQTGAVHQIEDIAVGRNVAVIELEAPEWWRRRPERLARVLPSNYGLDGLDVIAA